MELKTKRNKEGYYEIDGALYPSVTTILKVISKPALIYWALQQGAELQKKHNPDKKKLFTLFEKIRKDSSRRGVNVHKYIQHYLETGKFKRVVKNKGYYKAVQKFLEENDFIMDHSEITVYHKLYGYAGTCDFVGVLNGEPVVADFKTGKALYKEVELQLSAYYHALLEMELIPANKKLKAILFKEDGNYEIKELPERIEKFLNAKYLWEWFIT